MSDRHGKNHARRGGPPRRGLTLLELVIVLAILIVLAGILVPLLPGLLSDAHFSSGATIIDEMNKWVATYEALNRTQPDGLDLLLDTSGEIPDYCAFAHHESFGSQFLTCTLTDEDVTSLNLAGITNVYRMRTGTEPGFQPTFNCTEGTPTPLAEGIKVVQANAAFVQDRMGQGNRLYDQEPQGEEPGVQATYVVFGVGERCTMVGAKRGGITEAPVKGSPDANHGPDQIYGRCGLVYRLDRTGKTAATLVGACLLGKNGLVTSELLTNKYYDNQK